MKRYVKVAGDKYITMCIYIYNICIYVIIYIYIYIYLFVVYIYTYIYIYMLLVKSAGTSKESEANNFLGTLKKLFFGEVYNKNHYSKLLLIYTNDKIEHNL